MIFAARPPWFARFVARDSTGRAIRLERKGEGPERIDSLGALPVSLVLEAHASVLRATYGQIAAGC